VLVGNMVTNVAFHGRHLQPYCRLIRQSGFCRCSYPFISPSHRKCARRAAVSGDGTATGRTSAGQRSHYYTVWRRRWDCETRRGKSEREKSVSAIEGTTSDSRRGSLLAPGKTTSRLHCNSGTACLIFANTSLIPQRRNNHCAFSARTGFQTARGRD